MTDKELAQRLSGALDERIARASAAPVARERMNHMPSADDLTSPQVKAIPVKQLRWKNAIAAVLVVGMLGGIGLAASKLLDRTKQPQTGESGNSEITQTTEPLPEDELPVVSFEEDTKTLRVVGTGHYDRIDLSRLPEAADMIVEDDDFEFRILPTILWSSDSPIEDPVSYLPGYLDEVDKSLATIRQYVADNAPNEDVLAQTQKRVKLTLTSFGSINIYSSYTISLNLNGAFHWVGNLYAIGLNPDWNTKEWRVDAFGAWADYCRNPYCPTFLDYPELNPDGVDIFYYPYYQRAGGTGYLRSVNDRILLNDVISWCNLVFGRDWGGNVDETGRMFESHPALDASKEENQLSLMESMSLLNYLAGQHGDAKLVAYCFGACSFEEAFGMDFASAKAAWEQSLLDHFGDGSDENAELTQVSYDADSRTIRITGTTGYDRLDLSSYLDNAMSLEVEDDSFRLRVVLSVVENYADQANLNLADYLPGYLNRLDHSLAFVGQYVAEHAPKEEPVENTRKPVDVMVTGLQNRFSGVHSDKVTLSLASYFRHHGIFYTLALMNPETVEWQQLGYAYWVGLQKDPYNSIYAVGSFDDDFDYFYMKDYARLGGTSDPRDLNNQTLIHDANAWYNLVYGRDWGGNIAECRAISDIGEFHGFTGDPEKEGNDLCMVEAVSLINYLAEQYGEKQVAAFCFDTCTFEEAFGMDFASARAAWEQSLLDRFGDGSETPTEPAALPQVSYDADSRTVRITGTTGYDRLDLSSYLDNAMSLEVEDDRFQFSTYVALLANRFDDPAAELPAYLNRLDRSIDFIANYISDAAPNEEIAAQTRKPVKITMQANAKSYSNNTEDITLFLGSAFKRHGVLYTSALLNPACDTWYQLGYIYWVSFCLDPYNSLYVGVSFEDARDYSYYKDYFRMGGTGDPTPENFTLLNDANAWYNLVHGRDWGGSETECGHINEDSSFNGDPNLEGNDLGVAEAVSLINYLAEQYGEKQVAAFCFDTCTFEEAFGTDFATARAAWEQSLLDRFGDGSENP